jgi:Ca-activated chloride channel homolog
MLNVTVKSHRPYLRADAGLQKLFVMLKMAPPAEAATARPRLDLALVLDTSGSMRERAPGLEAPPEESPPAGLVDKLLHLVRPGSSKLDVATEAARRLLQSPHLRTEDTVSIIQFDDSSTVLATGRAGADAVDRLQQFSGGTQMALGLQNAQRGVTYLVPAQGYRGEVPPVDLVVEFTAEEALAASVDAEVMGYVQQRNVDNLVRQATARAATNPQQAARTLQVARSMTQRLGNRGMTVALARAEEELRGSGTISVGTRKTIKVGARTQTMKGDGPDATPQNVPSQDEIRRLTGA